VFGKEGIGGDCQDSIKELNGGHWKKTGGFKGTESGVAGVAAIGVTHTGKPKLEAKKKHGERKEKWAAEGGELAFHGPSWSVEVRRDLMSESTVRLGSNFWRRKPSSGKEGGKGQRKRGKNVVRFREEVPIRKKKVT